ILVTLALGPGFIFSKIAEVFSELVRPTSGRIGSTVAENRQPYFTEWARNFGPSLLNFPVFFWLFVTGSVVLFFNMIKNLGKTQRWTITSGFVVFLFAIIFSRYSSSGTLNGENFASIALYFIGVLALL